MSERSYIDKDQCLVYVIATVIDGLYCKPVKIGIAADADKRVATLQTGNPNQLAVIHWIPTPHRDWARELEADWHTAYADQRLNGEWFDVEPLNAIVALAQGAAAHLEDVFGKNAAAEIIDGLLLKESIARCTQILSRKIASGQVLS